MRLFNFSICLFVLVLVHTGAVFSAKAQSLASDSVSKSKLQFTHSAALGAIFRIGNENVFTRNSYDNTTQKNRTYIIGKYTQNFTLRFSHGIVFKKQHEAGICYGADIYFQKKYATALMPLMLYWSWQAPVKCRVKPFITQRIGYAFYFRNRQYEPLITYARIEGDAALETVLGISFAGKKKVSAQLAFVYRFQHLHSKAVYHTEGSLSNAYGLFSNLPSTVTEISDGLYHFVGFTVGLKF